MKNFYIIHTYVFNRIISQIIKMKMNLQERIIKSKLRFKLTHTK